MRVCGKRILKTIIAGGFFAMVAAAPALAEGVPCDLSDYKAQIGLTAATEGDTLAVSWNGDPGQEVRLVLAVKDGVPTVRTLALRKEGEAWKNLAANATPDFSVTTGLRRMSNQQLQPLRGLNVAITQEVLDRYRWDPFWDAPLDLAVSPTTGNFSNNPPPAAGLPGTDQPGLPRRREEIQTASAVYKVASCQVRTDGGRLEITFPGVTLGVFSGALQYTVYKGSNLIRQEILAKTDKPWVAYKYDAGLKGLAITADSRVAWRDIANNWQDYRFGGALNAARVPLAASNRLVMAEQGTAGSIAAFPPPHRFFWAREIAINMGYNWYRKDSDTTYSIGVRQNEHEDESENPANWALYSARPGTLQLMPVFLYPSLKRADETAGEALKFTHGDRYKPLPGYQVMNHHYHMDLGQRLLQEGKLDAKLPDLVALKSLGINIVSQIDSVMLRGFSDTGAPNIAAAAAAAAAPQEGRRRSSFDQFQITAASVEGARIHSDKNFLVMANQEIFGSPLGGHTDVLFSHPVYWDQRKPGQPFQETSATYGRVFHVGSAEDLMQMARQEEVLISMPHPRTKGSTGFPDAVKDRDFFKDPHYQGVGMRWGMGVDGSERRSCEIRCWPLLDDMSNWVVDLPIPMKFITSISEVRHMQPGDDIYSSSPVTYVHLATLPDPADPSPVIKALMRGDSFWTTGEVLISSYAVQGSGRQRTIVADVDWTFPLDFVEVVWGDGKTTGRQIISTTELPPFGSHRFEIPFDGAGKKWVRFAAWDSASNGAVAQPVRLKDLKLSPDRTERRAQRP